MIFNPSGGWRWHWRAWRWRPRWAGTLGQIEDWLMAQTEMPSDTLVLIGASAGWMMPPRWLARFETIHTWDIDPWAAPLFRHRHGQALRAQGRTLHTHTGDALVQLTALIAQQPQALFWFDNVLGQLCLFEPERHEALEQRLRTLHQTLAPVAWGSLHDRFSGPVDEQGLAIPPLRPVAPGSDAQSPEQQAWLHGIHAQSPWGDHLTGEVFPRGTPLVQIAWPFKPAHWHWLEMGWRPAQHAPPASLEARQDGPRPLRYSAHMNTQTCTRLHLATWLLASVLAGPVFASDTIALRHLPSRLQAIWDKTKPEMNEHSRCAAAFDGHSDPAKMVMRCSVYMRMGAEAERRALAHCEQERTSKGVHMPCKIVRE